MPSAAAESAETLLVDSYGRVAMPSNSAYTSKTGAALSHDLWVCGRNLAKQGDLGLSWTFDGPSSVHKSCTSYTSARYD